MSGSQEKMIENKLLQFLKHKNIPNMLCYGMPGSGKKTLLRNFLSKFYENESTMNEYVMKVDCELGKGIKFIRDELKFFAKTNTCNKNLFKSIILLNADKLTVDAQSALRRCIELFSETNRFFIIVEKLEHLQKPILSRFCHIYVNYDMSKNTNLHQVNLKNVIKNNDGLFKFKENRKKKLKGLLNKFKQKTDKIEKGKSEIDFIDLAEELYESAYTTYDIYTIVKHDNNYSYEDEMIYYICKNNIKNETLLIAFYLFFLFRNNNKIEMSEFIKYG